MKDYLSSENERNVRNKHIYERMLQIAFPENKALLIAHHLNVGDGSSVMEIPSADTLIFCHDIMEKVFGVNFMVIIEKLARTPTQNRDALLETHLRMYGLL